MSSLAITKTNMINYEINREVEFNSNNFCYKYLLDNNDLSDTSIKSYRVCLKNFTNWLKSNDINNPTRDDIKAYKIYLKASDYSICTKNQYLRAVKHFFNWLYSNELYPNIASNIKEFRDTRKHKRDSLTIDEVNKIVNDIGISSEVDLRDRAIIILASSLGLRANEIVNINLNDIEQRDNYYVVNILAKGYQEKSTKKVITKQVYDVLQAYINKKDNVKSKDALFTSTSNRAKGKRLTTDTLSKIVKQRFKNSGFNSDKLTLHSLRHLTADATLQATDNNIYKTQGYLRHKNITTTEIYLSEQEDIDVGLADEVYNTIFNPKKADKSKELKDAISTLNDNQIDLVLSYIDKIKGGN